MIGLSGLITPSLDEMVFVAREMERAGLHAAAADRRRDDQPAAHGGQDRAGVSASRSCTCSMRRARWRWCRACSARAKPMFDAENRAAQAEIREQYAARREKPLLTYRAGARQSSADRLGRPRDRVTWFVGRRYLDEMPLARAREVHRLDVLLLGVGAEGTVPRDSRASAVRRRRARAVRTRDRRC